MKKSNISIIIEKILRLLGNKKRFLTEPMAINYLKKCEVNNKKAYKVPQMYKNLATRKELENITYFKIIGGEKVILYLHGGAFINRPLVFHWEFLQNISEMTNATIYFPIYPLAPEFTFKDTYKFLIKLYKHILKEHKPEDITIMGDSAGATLTLGMAELLNKKKLPLPTRLIPLSPSLDVTFKNPEILKIEASDPMLSSVGCAYVCGQWAKGASSKNPLVSPKYIHLDNLPPTYVFVGTNEILYPDICDFVLKAKQQKANIHYFVKEGMNHVFPLFPIPEATEARKKIAEIILNKKIKPIINLY